MLAKGENAELGAGPFKVRVSAGRPIDVAAVLLGPGHRVRSDDDLVFFNHPEQDGVRVDGESVVVDGGSIPAEISTVAVVASADGPGSFDGVRIKASIEDGPWFEAPALDSGETVAVVVELYRRGATWKVRALGQGWAGGLAGLATDFGVSVEEEPAPVVVASERLSLRKEAVRISLEKKGAAGVRARVAIVLDASGSMRRMYKDGTVAGIVERMAPIALQVDDDAALDAWIFATAFARLPVLRVGELESWSHANLRMHEAVAADGGRVSLGGRNNEPEVIADILDFYSARPGDPVLVLFYSDGGVARDAHIARLLRQASDRPIFWQFVGLGQGRYGILERLDSLDGRTVDNAGFFAVDDIATIDDATLYDRVLAGFPDWLVAARAQGLL